MKKILIIGNSLSAWSVASAFINKKVNITIIGNKNNTFGAQQLSPNGFEALKKLIQNDDVKKIVYEIIKFQINSYNNNKTINLKNFYFNEFDLKYFSVSREMLINFLIKNVKNNIQINEINKSKLIDDKLFDYKLVLAGAKNLNGYGRLYFDVKNYIDQYNLNDYIDIPGYLNQQEIKKLYSESLIYVFPSLDEGFGIPLIESMKSKVPIICSDIEIFKEIGRDSVLYFKASNHIDLYEKLNILINNSGLRKKLIKLGKENVKRFNRINFLKEFEKIYN